MRAYEGHPQAPSPKLELKTREMLVKGIKVKILRVVKVKLNISSYYNIFYYRKNTLLYQYFKGCTGFTKKN